MAATIARAIGRSKETTTETTRLGPVSAEAQANTFKTFTTCQIKADGSGFVMIERTINGKRVRIASVVFDAEGQYGEERTYITARRGYTGVGNSVIENAPEQREVSRA